MIAETPRVGCILPNGWTVIALSDPIDGNMIVAACRDSHTGPSYVTWLWNARSGTIGGEYVYTLDHCAIDLFTRYESLRGTINA